MLTLMVFKLLLYLSLLNLPPFCCIVYDVKQLLKVKFDVYYAMTKRVLMIKRIA